PVSRPCVSSGRVHAARHHTRRFVWHRRPAAEQPDGTAGQAQWPDTERTRQRHGLHSAHRPARPPPGGPSVTSALPTESWTPRAADPHGAPWLPFNQLPSGGTGTLLNLTASGRSDSPDSLGDPQLSQVALDNLTPVVHVNQPRDGVQQCAPLHVR